MRAEIAVAIIMSTASVVGAVIAAWAAIASRKASQDKEFKAEVKAALDEIRQQQPVILHRIGQLEVKQDKSNELKERMAKAEERGKSNTHRLDRLEAAHG